jgi:urocanate hydratase
VKKKQKTKSIMHDSIPPQGLFPSHAMAPRMIMSTGMVVGSHSGKAEFERLRAVSATMYGQMTAGSLVRAGGRLIDDEMFFFFFFFFFFFCWSSHRTSNFIPSEPQCYIGPQGIVHGTMLTILNAGRLYLKTTGDMSGRSNVAAPDDLIVGIFFSRCFQLTPSNQ